MSSSPQDLFTLRMLGDNVTLKGHAWRALADELRPDSELQPRIAALLDGQPDTCPKCGGDGEVRNHDGSSTWATCPDCRGSGAAR